jgi:hypothetical protein
MKSTTRWFGWTAVMLPLHMGEQLLFGISELAALKRVIAGYLAWFRDPDYGIVLLVTAIGTLICGLTFGILVGGLARKISLGFWAAIAIGEVHHIIESVCAGHYTPGTVTAIPYIAFGILLLRAVALENSEPVPLAIPASSQT